MTTLDDWTGDVHAGDAFDVLPDLPDESIHACITDPPYGLAFMGRDWDDFEPREYQEWCEEWSRQVKRVLKPGGHLLAFSGNRTHHRLFTGVEDAGFEIRDTLTWHYGSGFPKASDVSKTIDKRADAEREVVGTYTNPRTGESHEYANDTDTKNTYALDDRDGEAAREITEPATGAAKKWDGWKTGLKPATEFVVLARKPYEGATVDSVLENGTGALNIDACRVDTNGERLSFGNREIGDGNKYNPQPEADDGGEQHTEGRYPANVIFDEVAAEQLDEQVGELPTGETRAEASSIYVKDYTDEERSNKTHMNGGDSGGPSRYFYTSKASRSERTNDGAIENDHPTVKPIDLMEWLIRLVTREGQVVLDPFAGSGTTCLAAKGLGREFVGIERQDKWADVARVRCGLTPDDPSVVRGDDAQRGLEAFDP